MKSFPQTLMLVFLLVAGVCGQHGNHVAPETAASIRLLDTRGFVHKQVSTTNVEAQKYFDQGLTLMYAYNRWDAAKSFKRAAELDPTLAIAWWGVAETMFTRSTERPDRVASMKEAREAIERAMALKAPPSERVYIEATWKLFSTAEKSDQKVLDANYAAAMKKIYQSSPDDPDAAVLYHWSRSSIKPDESWKRNGTPSPWTREGDRILEDGMKLHPRHLGLNHEYIHHVESSPSPERALRSADLLRSFKLSEPELGHLVHMPAHIYIRVGDFQKAAESNQEAARNVNAQMSSDFKYWHFAHVYQFLRLSYYMQGNYEKLRLNDMVAFDHQYPNATADEKKRRGFDLTMISRFRRWKDVLEFQLPDKPIANMYYQRAFALAATGKVAEAEAEQAKWFAACKCGPDSPRPEGEDQMRIITINRLAARIASAKSDDDRALELLQRAVSLEDELGYAEPPMSIEPVRVNLGGLLLRMGRFVEAEKTFREDLLWNRGNGRSLFGLWKALEAQKRSKEARKAEREFQAAWKYADTQLDVAEL